MADGKLMVDTSLLIGYFRKTDKPKARLLSQFKSAGRLYISSITEFEVVNGATAAHLEFWDKMLARFTVLDFDSRAARRAAEVIAGLKAKRRSIDKPDLFIAATVLVHGMALDTLNRKHFADIEGLTLMMA